ncbi:MFS transporter [Sphingobium sp. HWE2-09]|uniref:MFS transporter n=1 Tax=Sphingobium sp. HWE2-09 TaxID=3108390 RepID=UPI002DC932B7|nr:MFS transporter [Sphingobium sp. HWE2-09]
MADAPISADIALLPAGRTRTGGRRFFVLALITIVLALSTGDRATLSVAASGLSRELGIGPLQMGWLFSAFSWSYFLAQLPAGYLVDRIGARIAILVAVISWSIATVAISGVGYVAAPVVAIYLLRILLGILEAPVTPACARIIAAWFPPDERGVAGAIFNSAQYLSLAVFTPLMGFLFHAAGWEAIFSVMGALGVAFAVLWAVQYQAPDRDRRLSPAELDDITARGALTGLMESGQQTDGSQAKPAVKVRIWSLLSNRMLLGIFLAQYCVASLSTFFISWFPSYLVEARHLSVLEAGFVAALPAICGCVGGISAGFFSDWLLRRTGALSWARKLPITMGLGLSATIILCNYTASNSIVVLIMCVAFFGKGFGALGWTVIADTAPREAIGVTGALFNAAGSVGGIITPIAIGAIVSQTGSYDGALLYVGIHVLAAVAAYWLIVGKIERYAFDR